MKTRLTLHKTYYDQGFWNIPVHLDRYVRKDEGPITLLLGKYKREIQAYVNRSANQNGTARIMGKRVLRDWFQQNYDVMDKVPVRFVTPNMIVLGGTSRDKSDNPLNMRILKAKVTEQGVIIPKSLLPDVDEVDIRKRNGVIEVAPVDEERHSSLAKFGRNPGAAESDDSGNAVQTHLTLWKSFYDSGYLDVPIYFDECVRPDEGPMTLALGRGEREIKACVNRSVNQHGNARIMGGESLRDWFRENYEVREKILVSFDSPSKITLGGPILTPSKGEAATIWDLGKDPIPAEELDIRDASVNLDKYIYGE